MHLQKRVVAVEIRRRRVDRRARDLARRRTLRQRDIHHAIHISTGPHRRHAAREVEAREALTQLTVDVRASRIVRVLVEHHEPGDHALAGCIDDRGVFRDRRVRANRRDGSVTNDDRLIRARRRARPVNHSNVRERDDRRVNLDELANARADLQALRSREANDGDEQSESKRSAAERHG